MTGVAGGVGAGAPAVPFAPAVAEVPGCVAEVGVDLQWGVMRSAGSVGLHLAASSAASAPCGVAAAGGWGCRGGGPWLPLLTPCC